MSLSDMKENPFTLPSDGKAFKLRNDENDKKELHNVSQAKSQKIWEKGLKENTSTQKRLASLLREPGIDSETSVIQTLNHTAKASSKHTNPRTIVQDKESMAEFIAKKREMFLLHLSLNNKHEEIKKLEDKAVAKEEALRQGEEKLEQDAMKFDAFLKENDRKTHEAMKKAEHETKLKNDKIQEIRKLNEQLQIVENDISKHKDALDDCLRYKKFLDSLTPSDWLEKYDNPISADRSSVRSTTTSSEQGKRTDEVSWKNAPDHEKKSSTKQALNSADYESGLDQTEPETSRSGLGNVTPMYFTQPSQLLDIFQALEEQNLFLIQNSQDTEHALEELKTTYKNAQQKMTVETTALRNNIDKLVESIEEEKRRANHLKTRMAANTCADDSFTPAQQESFLKQLHVKVMQVYEHCGFDAGSNPSTLTMLGELETKLEDLLQTLSTLPQEYVIKAERDKEKKRRERKRAEQQALQVEQQEERNRKAIERSLQKPNIHKGRKVMESVRPSRRIVREVVVDASEQDLDELKYLS